MSQELAFSDLWVDFLPSNGRRRGRDTHKYTLFGGSRGQGKSCWLRWYLIRFCCAVRRGLRGVRVMLGCENYPALDDRHLSKIQN